MKDLTAEIFAVGKWNGFDITAAMLIELANNFTRLGEFVDVPLKLGHNEDQPLTDGQPALGWVSAVWVEGEKLFAKFIDIPEIVYNAIEKKQYKNVSIEALFDVEHKGKNYGTVLTAVALLGVDMPAVNTLADLTTYMTANNLAFTSHATFSKKPINNNSGGSTMTPKEQAEFDSMKAKVAAQDKVIEQSATDEVKFKADLSAKDTELKDLKENDAKAEFARETETVKADLETLVKENKISPAQRDDMIKEFTAENASAVKFTIKTLKGNVATKGNGEHGKEHKSNGNEDLPADQQITIGARKFAAENKVSFSEGVTHMLETNPTLAREYADINDQES